MTSSSDAIAQPTRELVEALVARGHTVAVAESLTGGLLVGELVSVPGASASVLGGVVAYATPLKARLLGVDERLLAEHGAVHPEVARQMASGVRERLGLAGPATWGISTTGVAGPEPQDGQPVGTVFVGIATEGWTEAYPLHLEGDRASIRAAVVAEAVRLLTNVVAE